MPHRYATDEKYALSTEKAISKRFAELLSIVPILLDGKTAAAEIYRGDTLHESVETSDINDVVHGLSAIDYALEKLTETDQKYGQTTTPVEDGIGRFERSDGIVAVAVRPTETNDAEQRIAWNVKMSAADQRVLFGEVIKDKPLNITLRLDLERIDRVLSLDIGGSVEAVRKNQPLNYMLAKLTTIGAQTYNNRTGVDKHRHDYHVREVFTKQQANPAEYQRWITSVMYSLRSDQ
ncbi:MAG: hypothetical protein EOP04_28275 [Proteobacteria bacterium]|nr:MAG: hypothetical protein EOP04_28275 [Pseudomonadota bacterium]